MDEIVVPQSNSLREEFLSQLESSSLTVPQTVRLMRQATGMTIVEYAKHVGVSQRYLGDIERGLMNPTVDMLEKLAQPFGLEVCMRRKRS